VRMFDIWEDIKAQMLGSFNHAQTNIQMPSSTTIAPNLPQMQQLPQMQNEIMQQLQRLRQAQ